jgi:hypothetical protein
MAKKARSDIRETYNTLVQKLGDKRYKKDESELSLMQEHCSKIEYAMGGASLLTPKRKLVMVPESRLG